MNKDVIYIEPEDDITDILSGVKDSKAKIVALVPPKKAGGLRSAVNFKLLARTAKDAGKVVVLVTADGALLKLAAGANIPVAKNLQSKPEVPTGGTMIAETAPEGDVIDGEEAKAIVETEKKAAKTDEEVVVESVDLGEEEATEEDEAKENKKSKKKSAVPNFDRYRKFIIMGAIGLVLIVGFVVWAVVIAPSAKIMVSVRTTSRPFSEAVTFTTSESKQDTEGGVFLLEEQKITKQSEVEFEATGETDKGNRATGSITTSYTFNNPGDSISVAANAAFSRGELKYLSNKAVTVTAPNDLNDCDGRQGYRCIMNAKIEVTAEAPGDKYNTTSSSSWSVPVSGLSISSVSISGGTTKMVKVVSASDVEKAKKDLESTSTSEGRAELVADFPSGLLPISSSFKVETSDPVATPAVGEEVGQDTRPKLVAKTTFVMYGVDRVRIAEYIEQRSWQSIGTENDQMVYSTGVSDNADENKAFIESFRQIGEAYTGRLKSVTKIGPKVTDEMVIEKSLGRKIGEVQSLLKSINGVGSVKVETSFFWVSSVPSDINKVSVEITVE